MGPAGWIVLAIDLVIAAKFVWHLLKWRSWHMPQENIDLDHSAEVAGKVLKVSMASMFRFAGIRRRGRHYRR
jgi:hypothetical protein